MLPATSTRGARSSPIGRASWPAQRSASSSSQGSRTGAVAAKPCARKRPWPVSPHEKPALFVSRLTTRNFFGKTLKSASGLTRPTGPDLPSMRLFARGATLSSASSIPSSPSRPSCTSRHGRSTSEPLGLSIPVIFGCVAEHRMEANRPPALAFAGLARELSASAMPGSTTNTGAPPNRAQRSLRRARAPLRRFFSRLITHSVRAREQPLRTRAFPRRCSLRRHPTCPSSWRPRTLFWRLSRCVGRPGASPRPMIAPCALMPRRHDPVQICARRPALRLRDPPIDAVRCPTCPAGATTASAVSPPPCKPTTTAAAASRMGRRTGRWRPRGGRCRAVAAIAGGRARAAGSPHAGRVGAGALGLGSAAQAALEGPRVDFLMSNRHA